MRRTLAIGTIILMGTLAACSASPPAGTDGDIDNGWAVLPTAVAYAPTAGTCDSEPPKAVAGLSSVRKVSCDVDHSAETVHVGTLTGAVADQTTSPKPTDLGLAGPWQECDTEATKYVGQPWSDGLFDLYLVLPTQNAWKGGARWFRCDLNAIADLNDYRPKDRKGSLKGNLDPDTLLGCFQVTSGADNKISGKSPRPCTSAHNAEYVGSVWSNLPAYPTTKAQFDQVFNTCYKKIDAFVGMTNAPAGTFIARAGSADEWKAGYRLIRCHIWLNKKSMTKSAKGTKGSGLPR